MLTLCKEEIVNTCCERQSCWPLGDHTKKFKKKMGEELGKEHKTRTEGGQKTERMDQNKRS